MKVVFALVALAVSSYAFAGPECTKEPKDKWQKEEAFKEKLKTDGYKIKVFKVTSGNCYEIYGWDSKGKKVEIYFNPVSGDKVKENLEK